MVSDNTQVKARELYVLADEVEIQFLNNLVI